MPAQPINRHSVIIWRYPAPTVMLVFVLMAFGFALLFQPDRWYSTPAYGNLLVILDVQVWGAIYLVIGIGVLIPLLIKQIRVLAVIAHLLAFLLLLSWEVAFLVRWGIEMDSKTTAANVINWFSHVALVLWSAVRINDDEDRALENITNKAGD